jgi:T-complex protein 1 subunit gamma
MQLPVTVLNANTKREQGKKAQLGNIAAAKVLACSGPLPPPARLDWRLAAAADPATRPQTVADIIRTTLGPRSMLKMLLDASGGSHRCRRAVGVSAPAPDSLTGALSQASCSPTMGTRSCARSTWRTPRPRWGALSPAGQHRG